MQQLHKLSFWLLRPSLAIVLAQIFMRERATVTTLPAEISEELAILKRVQEAVRAKAIRSAPDMADVDRRLVELRDEAASAAAHDLPALFDQLNVHQALSKIDFRDELPNMYAPYFAHMRLQENDGRVRDILIGHRTFIDNERDVTIIDWKNAPLAKVFFTCMQGDEFSQKLPGRTIDGMMLARRIITFERGELIGVMSPDRNILFNETDGWRVDEGDHQPHLRGGSGAADRGQSFGTGRTGQRIPDVSALLDRTQFDLLNRAEDEHLLVLGGAGSGKTTVALHRLASVHAKSPRMFAQDRMMVIVPDIGLCLLSRRILKSLGLSRVRVGTFEEWIADESRRVLKAIPNLICQATPYSVTKLKRHPALLEVFPDLMRHRMETFAEQFARLMPFAIEWIPSFLETAGQNLKQKLERAERSLLNFIVETNASSEDELSNRRFAIQKAFESFHLQMMNFDTDRQYLFSNRELMERVVASSDGGLLVESVDATLRHTAKQFAPPDFTADMVGTGDNSIIALDGVDVRDEEQDEYRGTIDIEDCSVVFMLLHYYTGQFTTRHGALGQYMHMVIDEAQEMAPVELQVLGHALSSDASVTIAGDAAQQTDPSTTFAAWSAVMQQLRIGHVGGVQLETNYRSPRPVADFARLVLGPLAPTVAPKVKREGVPVLKSRFSDIGHAAIVLREALEELVYAEPRASVAVICRDHETITVFEEVLKTVPRVRIVRDGRFSFDPGIDITEVSQVKGLEFDYVVIPDATVANYPDQADSRRIMHVAATRAMHQLWVIAVGNPSPIIGPM
jgi:DNA helicase-2/ATP-dependent DNA helicase PcrA